MSTESEKGYKEQAYENIEMCCQTLCESDKVIEYIRFLEEENKLLKQMLSYEKKDFTSH